MRLEGEYRFEASVQEVWDALFDPVILAAVMPGCEKLELVDGHYVGEIKVKVGPVQGKFTGKVELLDRSEPHSYRMVVDGRGAPGFVKANATVALAAEDGGTRIRYDADAQVGGKIASVGQRLLEASSRAIVAQSLEGLHANIKLRAAAYREAEAKAAVAIAATPAAEPAVAGGEPIPLDAAAAVAAAPSEAAAAPSDAAVASSDAAVAAALATPGEPALPVIAELAAVAAIEPVPPAAAEPTLAAAEPTPAAVEPAAVSEPPAAKPATPTAAAPSVTAASPTAPSAPATPAAKPAVEFTPVKVKQADLAKGVARELASTLFPRSVLVAIIAVQAAVIAWLLLR